MNENQPIWMKWSRVFHRWGISNGVASVLDGAGSFSYLVAQVLYISQPLLSDVIAPGSIQAFAQMLENPVEKKEFVSMLREAPFSGTSS